MVLRKLKGQWVSVRQLVGGKEKAFGGMATYAFDGNKAAYSSGGRPAIPLSFEADRKRPGAFQVFRANDKTPTKYFFKIEKGELYLVPTRTSDPKAKPDFSGKSANVRILSREKK